MDRRELALCIGALMLCVFLAALDSSIVANALPRVIADLHGFELYAWVTTGYLLASTAITPIGGKLGDRYGRKRMMLGGAVFFTLSTLLCGLAQSMPQLVALRTLQGIGGGVLAASVFAVMGQLLAPADRARLSGVITGVFSLAGVVGPIVGGFLTDVFSWRAVFYINLPFAILALIVIWRFFPDIRYSVGRRPIDVAGAVTSVVGIVLLLLALSWGGREYAWNSPMVLGLLGGGVAVLALFMWFEARAADPILPLGLFRNDVVAISSTNSLAQSMAQICLALFVPLYAQGVLGVSATLSGTVMLPLLGAMLISNLAAGFLIAHIGRYKLFAVIGFGCTVLGFGALTQLGPTSPLGALAVCLAVIGTGTGMIFPTLTLSYQSAVEFHELGVATALNQFCRSIGSTLGSALFGSLLILRFLPSVQSAVPVEISVWLEGPGGGSIRDPQTLLNPSAADAMREAVSSAFPLDAAAPDAVLAAVRVGLADSIHWVFAAAALVAFGGLVGSVIWREVPMRRSR